MIRLITVLSFFLLSSIVTNAQYAEISQILEVRMDQKKSEDPYHRVVLLMAEQLNLDSLVEVFENDQVAHKERTRRTVIALQKTAKNSQGQLLSELRKDINLNAELIRLAEPYWISNLFIIEAKRSYILALQSNPDLRLIDLDRDEFIKTDPVEVSLDNGIESPQGKEPGHVAINAHKLWYRGYTGRGALGMIIDDGTYGLHPALFKNFKGQYADIGESYHGGSYPGCISSDSHGIHVAGTVVGLDPEARDTIGVAFNSYWIGSGATSGCGGNLGGIAAFQWALNPDGNTATTDDVPDVINCSWASTSGGAGPAQCNGTFVNILNSLEAASVAVVFSAGNDGPNASTVTEPKNINTSLVNTFTVGNLDASSGTLPINFSSSRGPSICGKTGSLLIKPEVSAPGTNIRSALGADAYGMLTGTSMAAPHVSGALLILRGAFPTATGTELKLALYNTARDLGTVGEDNAYGMGIIDLEAAFDTLAKKYSPNPRESYNYDLAISGITNPEKAVCANNLVPKVEVVNYGTSSVIDIKITYWVDNGAKRTHTWNGILTPRSKREIGLPAINFTNSLGVHVLHTEVEMLNSGTDQDLMNNTFQKEFEVPGSINVPYLQNFEVSTFALTNWLVYNPDFQNGWAFKIFNGANSGLRAMAINKYIDRLRGRKDAMFLPKVNVPANGFLSIAYSYSHRLRSPAFLDTLKLMISNDCGNNWTTIRSQFGNDLSTKVGYQNSEYIPTGSQDYQRDTIDLSPFVSSTQILIKFEVVNRNGNAIYIDDVALFNAGNTSLEPSAQTSVRVYPNPGNALFNVQYAGFSASFLDYSLRNALGQTLERMRIRNSENGLILLDLENQPSGVYHFKIEDGKNTHHQRIIKY